MQGGSTRSAREGSHFVRLEYPLRIRAGRFRFLPPAPFARRYVAMPESTSFPSGHSASAFAFAYAIGRHYPGLVLPVRLLAGAVAYSRVHTGVHYPGDVALGSVIGVGTAAVVSRACDLYARSAKQGLADGRVVLGPAARFSR